MHGPLFLWIGCLAIVLSASSCVGPFGRGNYETPKYQTVVSDGSFEVRDYPEVVVATAPMGEARAKQNSAFRSLFGYISGENERDQKIAMTTPVFGSMKGEARKMSFVVPAEVVAKGVPSAKDPEVKIATRTAGRFAVYRYSGRWTPAKEEDARKKLQAWMQGKKLKSKGEFEKANYDPPFTPPPLRRNEVLIRLAD